MNIKKHYLFTIIMIVLIILTLIGIFLMNKETKHIVSFDTDGGSHIDIQVVEDIVIKPDDPIKEGYKFLYWSYDGKEYDFTQKVSDNITLKAKWEKTINNYVVKFDSNGGSSISSITVKGGNKVTKPKNPTKDGYTFNGWYNGNTLFNFNTPVTSDITLTAKWTKKTASVKYYTITFDSNGGSFTQSQLIKEKEKGVKPQTPKKDGYTFNGWYNGNTLYNFNTPVTSDITLTAKWTKKINSVNVKIATWNVYGFLLANPSKIGDVIRNHSVDIVGIQEGRGPNANYNSSQELANSLNYNVAAITKPFQVNAVISPKKYAVKSSGEIFLNSNCSDPYGESDRRLAKAIITINNVNISVYSGHFGLGNCTENHFQSAINQIKNDPNPVVILADYNSYEINLFNKYFTNNGFVIASYDKTSHNMWGKNSYCDSILVSSKGHINVKSSEVADVYNTYSDHNMVMATLEIY